MNIYVAQCIADYQSLQIAGGPEFPADVADKRDKCIDDIVNTNFSKLIDDIAEALLPNYGIYWEDVYFEMLNGNVASLEAEIKNVTIFSGDKPLNSATNLSTPPLRGLKGTPL